jgi:hypothetical protein
VGAQGGDKGDTDRPDALVRAYTVAVQKFDMQLIIGRRFSIVAQVEVLFPECWSGVGHNGSLELLISSLEECASITRLKLWFSWLRYFRQI